MELCKCLLPHRKPSAHHLPYHNGCQCLVAVKVHLFPFWILVLNMGKYTAFHGHTVYLALGTPFYVKWFDAPNS